MIASAADEAVLRMRLHQPHAAAVAASVQRAVADQHPPVLDGSDAARGVERHLQLHAEVEVGDQQPARLAVAAEPEATFAELDRLMPSASQVAMASFAPRLNCYGGRDHLKALLAIMAHPFTKPRDPVADAQERIAARALEVS